MSVNVRVNDLGLEDRVLLGMESMLYQASQDSTRVLMFSLALGVWAIV